LAFSRDGRTHIDGFKNMVTKREKVTALQ